MKKLITLLILIFNFFLLNAQYTMTEKDIIKLEDAERKAMLERDTIILLKLWAPDFTANTPANRITTTRRELIDIIKVGIFNFSLFDRKIEKIFIKDNVAITMGNETVIPVGNNPKTGQTIRRRYTNIWMKQNGVWRLTARHANEICGT